MKKLRTEEEWNNLSMTDRAKYIKAGVESGLTDLESIKKAYNIYAEGGPMEESQQQDSSPEENTAEESTLPIKRSPILPTKRSPVLSKGKYDSYVPIKVEEDPSAYKERDRMISYYSRNIPYNEVNKAVEALQKEGATKAQIAGMLGNANAETHNLQGGKQTNGKAVGYYQLEGDHRAKYERFLRENNLPDNLASESIYAYRYMKKDTSKKTPYETQDSRYWRDKWSKQGVYQGITTKDALRKWNQNNPDSTSDAFLNLFEKAGFPRDQIRRDYSSQFYFDPNIKWEDYFPNIKAFGGGINKFAIGGPQKTELYAPPTYKAISPDEFLANIINPDFQHQSDRLNPVSIKTKEDIKQEVPEQPILRAQDKSEEALLSLHDKNPNSETKFGRLYNNTVEPILKLIPVVSSGMYISDAIRDIENKEIADGILNLVLAALSFYPAGSEAKTVLNISKNTIKKEIPGIIDKAGFFVKKPGTYTRGIGNKEGLIDLVQSGIVRGNPLGTEVTAKDFNKLIGKNRFKYRDIFKETGRKGIENRWYNRTLSKEDFESIKKASEKILGKNNTNVGNVGLYNDIRLFRSKPLDNYNSYDDYVRTLETERMNFLENPMVTVGKDGNPLAYFYDDGRNPFKGYKYAKSKYGVRISNVDNYEPFIHEHHLHPSFNIPPKLFDENVEVFKNTLFGPIRIKKSDLLK